MGTLALTLPTIGQPNSTEDVKIPNALTAIQTEYNTNIPNVLGAWKPLFTFNSLMNAGAPTNGTPTWFSTGSVLSPSGAAHTNQSVFPYIDPADYAISGYT